MAELVDTRNLLLSIRETGYRSFAHTIAELIDNSIQANASQVSVGITSANGGRITVVDNGNGMSVDTLRLALRFGGSTRFNDRTGTGRFGMGLPTSSLSLARRVDVFTWRCTGSVQHSFLDLDRLRQMERARLPEPRSVRRPKFVPSTSQGTAIILTRCDRSGKLDDDDNLARTKFELGRIFRRILVGKFELRLNDVAIKAFDPLFLRDCQLGASASQYGPVLEYSLPTQGGSAKVQVVFSELPVEAWRTISNPEKQRLGISRGAGVSVVRADREIAYGWYFLGAKRRENYDDWWRCEVRFDPLLDEYFGVNHTKQQISPRADLDRLLTPDLENIARVLNARVRREFVRTAKRPVSAPARAASTQDRFLPRITGSTSPKRRALGYRILVDARMEESAFYRVELAGSEVVVHLNGNHPMSSLYLEAKRRDVHQLRLCEFLILAAARAELSASNGRSKWWFRRFRSGWSDTLAAFLGN